MLIEFRFENHRSFRAEAVLTLEAETSSNEADPRSRIVKGHNKPLLSVAALYGGNASGKSNVLHALTYMRNAVLQSHRAWRPDGDIARDPFAFGPSKKEPSFFEIRLLIESIQYEYGFTASDQSFLEEWLYAWPNGKKQIWFERDQGNKFKFGEHLKGENRVIEQLTRSNSLFLSAAAQNKHSQLSQIYSWFHTTWPHVLNFKNKSTQELNGAFWIFETPEMIRLPDLGTKSDPFLERIRTMLGTADIGIVDMKQVKKDSDDPLRKRGFSGIVFKHRSKYKDAWLPFEEESAGTKTLFHLTIPILETLNDGGVLLVDELESSLHPALAQEIVRLFHNPATNPLNAQLIFTTHDTNLLGTTLGEPTLRRDQVWLTEKDKEGASILYPLTDYKPRKEENLERGYLQGRYGAIPFLGNFYSEWKDHAPSSS